LSIEAPLAIEAAAAWNVMKDYDAVAGMISIDSLAGCNDHACGLMAVNTRWRE
jgi:hypothetical protein